MSLLPRWFNRLPKPGSWKGDLSKFFQDLDERTGLNTGLSVYSTGDSVIIEANVPGLTAKEVDVSIDDDGLLWIKGERQLEEKSKDKNFYRKAQRSYTYCIPLGEEVDLTQEPIALCKDGVMKITFSKRKDKIKESKKIPVKE